MAKLEPNSIIASSLDNFLIFDNGYYREMPFVTIVVGSSSVGQNVTLTFEDADDADAAKVTLEGRPDSNITSRTFNTSGSVMQTMYSLMECLKLNSIVYDVHPSDTNVLKMGLDTSRKWRITSDYLSVGGNYVSYNPDSLNKWVVMVSGNVDSETSQFSLEKYNNNSEVSFNISAPFAYITSKFPFKISLSAYSVNSGTVNMQTITNSTLTVMPTTLDKFETVDYSRYYIPGGNSEKKDFLTRNTKRNYNYGEYVGLSILTDRSIGNVTLLKKYYTNSGMFLTSNTGCYRKEYNYSRLDFYDTLGISEVEDSFSRQVGYVDVVAVDGSTELTNPVRFVVEPKCEGNDTLFFINSIGGLDSYNFTGEHQFRSSIDERTTYMKNPQKPFADTYELEHSKQVRIDGRYTSSTGLVNESTANWLTELQRSKYVFKLTDGKYVMVLVEEMDIDITDTEKYYDVQCVYRYADTGINV